MQVNLHVFLFASPTPPLSSPCGSLLVVVMISLTCLNKPTPMPPQKRPRLPHKTTPMIPALVWVEEKGWRLTSDFQRATTSDNLTLYHGIYQVTVMHMILGNFYYFLSVPSFFTLPCTLSRHRLLIGFIYSSN